MIKAIRIKVFHPEKINNDVVKKLGKATRACPVKRSLSNDVEIQIEYVTD